MQKMPHALSEPAEAGLTQSLTRAALSNQPCHVGRSTFRVMAINGRSFSLAAVDTETGLRVTCSSWGYDGANGEHVSPVLLVRSGILSTRRAVSTSRALEWLLSSFSTWRYLHFDSDLVNWSAVPGGWARSRTPRQAVTPPALVLETGWVSMLSAAWMLYAPTCGAIDPPYLSDLVVAISLVDSVKRASGASHIIDGRWA